MAIKRTSVGLTIKEYALITLGILLYVLGWSIFLVTNNLVGGGVTGLSAILQYATHGVIKIGYSYFVINVALIIAALFVLGFSFGWKTIYATVLASIRKVEDLMKTSPEMAATIRDITSNINSKN